MLRRSALGLLAGIGVGLLAASSLTLPAWGQSEWTPLLSPEALEDRLGQDGLVIIDIRGKAMDGDFSSGHIPGAVWSKYPSDWRRSDLLEDTTPTAAELAERLSGLGISNRSSVVIVAAGATASDFGGAARVYWTLKYAGHDAVAILDGGWASWVASKRPTESGGADPTPAVFAVKLRPELLASTADVESGLSSGAVLLDARSEELFLGEATNPSLPLSGHLPGALNLDSSGFFDPVTQRLRPASDLLDLLPQQALAPTDRIITYCSGGHLSATDWFVLHELLGYSNAALYVDSMAGWTQDPARPVVRGN